MRRSVVALLLLSALPVVASAQTDSVTPPTVAAPLSAESLSVAPMAPRQVLTQRTWGLGLSLTAIGGAEDLPVSIRVPLRFGSRWRFEPELAISRSTSELSTYVNDPSNPTSPTHDTGPEFRSMSLALAIVRVTPLDNTVRVYFGPRFGMARRTSIYDLDGSDGNQEASVVFVDHSFGWLSGVEAAVGTRLTLGGEVGVTYVKKGEARVKQPAYYYSGFQDGGHYLSTTGAIVMRWFPGAR